MESAQVNTDTNEFQPISATGATHAIQLQSTLTCPVCGERSTETMPWDACQFFYECAGCGTMLRPKPGDCCVFCSYGDVPCPPIQDARGMNTQAGCC
jgi:hypothetical protein